MGVSEEDGLWYEAFCGVFRRRPVLERYRTRDIKLAAWWGWLWCVAFRGVCRQRPVVEGCRSSRRPGGGRGGRTGG